MSNGRRDDRNRPPPPPAPPGGNPGGNTGGNPGREGGGRRRHRSHGPRRESLPPPAPNDSIGNQALPAEPRLPRPAPIPSRPPPPPPPRGNEREPPRERHRGNEREPPREPPREPFREPPREAPRDGSREPPRERNDRSDRGFRGERDREPPRDPRRERDRERGNEPRANDRVDEPRAPRPAGPPPRGRAPMQPRERSEVAPAPREPEVREAVSPEKRPVEPIEKELPAPALPVELPPGKRRLFLVGPEDPERECVLGPAFPVYDWALDGVLCAVVPVRRGDGDRPFECDAGELPLRKGESVLVESERGVELVVVLSPPRRQWLPRRPGARVMRRAQEADLQVETRLRLREAEALRTGNEVVRELNLPAKMVRAEVALQGGRTTLFLAAEERIELRELARRLTNALRGRVELRLVGLRDAARVVGGIGPCGLQLCCNTFLSEFAPVSIRMAKDQGLALNPQRVSGVCGRLLCCLVYEDAFYRAQRSLFPKHGKRVKTPKGEGIVRDVDVLARTVRVSFVDGTFETFDVGDVATMQAQGAPAPRNEEEEPEENAPKS